MKKYLDTAAPQCEDDPSTTEELAVDEHIKRLYNHDWRTLEEWAKSLDELADMDDEEITKIVDDITKGQESHSDD